METKYGAWLDGILDRYADAMIILCITVASLDKFAHAC